jgi:hypothetical protein
VKRFVVAFVSGALFAVGLGVSGMTHPTKVLAFLDVAGAWDPSLAFVMGAGLVVNFVAFGIGMARGGPLLGAAFSMPEATNIDARLVGGAAIFGVGWGLGGFCPGPALVSVAAGAAPVLAFVAAMVASMWLFDAIDARVPSERIEAVQLDG